MAQLILRDISVRTLRSMKHILLRSVFLFVLYVTPRAWGAAKDAVAPFTVTVVPSSSETNGSRIVIGGDKPKDFYVVLTNTSKKSEPVFEAWNSWGFRAVSFELTLPDGKKIAISKGAAIWTRNFPSIFQIPPGEHQVYALCLDKRWETHPKLDSDFEIQIKLKAIYQVEATPESTEHKVWTGRVESKSYDFTLEHLGAGE